MYILPICSLITPCDEAEHCCVVCTCYYVGGEEGRAAVVVVVWMDQVILNSKKWDFQIRINLIQIILFF